MAPLGLYADADLGDAISDESIAVISVGEQSEPCSPSDDPQGVICSDRDVARSAPTVDVYAEVRTCEGIRDTWTVAPTPKRRLVQRVAERML